MYGEAVGSTAVGDKLFPDLAMHHMPQIVSIIFIIALISALFPSADGALTALTSSFCIDILGMKRRTDWTENEKVKKRQRIHLIIAFLFLLIVLVFYKIDSSSMINVILAMASYTYGPLLGLFTFGILTRRPVQDKLVPWVCLLAPLLCFLLVKYQHLLFGNYKIGFELLLINGFLTFLGLWLISKRQGETA